MGSGGQGTHHPAAVVVEASHTKAADAAVLRAGRPACVACLAGLPSIQHVVHGVRQQHSFHVGGRHNARVGAAGQEEGKQRHYHRPMARIPAGVGCNVGKERTATPSTSIRILPVMALDRQRKQCETLRHKAGWGGHPILEAGARHCGRAWVARLGAMAHLCQGWRSGPGSRGRVVTTKAA